MDDIWSEDVHYVVYLNRSIDHWSTRQQNYSLRLLQDGNESFTSLRIPTLHVMGLISNADFKFLLLDFIKFFRNKIVRHDIDAALGLKYLAAFLDELYLIRSDLGYPFQNLIMPGKSLLQIHYIK